MPVLLFVCAACLLARQNQADLDGYSDQAREAMAAKKWDAAARALEHLARLAPDVAAVHANLGLAYYFEGRPGDALASFERARKLNPQLPEVRSMIGISKADLGRCNEAMDLLVPAFQHSADTETGKLAGLHLLRCYSQLEQPEKGIATGETLLQRFPNDPEILYQVSHLHAERSSDLMATLLRTSPDSAWLHYANAQVQETLGRTDVATQEYRHALEKDPHMSGVHYRLGRLLLLGDSRTPERTEQARREFEEELTISPANADAEYELGEIARERNLPEAARAHFERALQFHPNFVEAHLGAAKLLLAAGQPAAALPHLLEAERLDPANRIPHYLSASAYKTLGNPSEAAKELALYRKLEENKSSAQSQHPDSN
jgi:tetratricopeptide (TPR) repeat protein